MWLDARAELPRREERAVGDCTVILGKSSNVSSITSVNVGGVRHLCSVTALGVHLQGVNLRVHQHYQVSTCQSVVIVTLGTYLRLPNQLVLTHRVVPYFHKQQQRRLPC